MTRKRMVKLLMAMGCDRNWANDFAKIFQFWRHLVSYGEFQDMLENPYEYIGEKQLRRVIENGGIPSAHDLGIEVPPESNTEALNESLSATIRRMELEACRAFAASRFDRLSSDSINNVIGPVALDYMKERT